MIVGMDFGTTNSGMAVYDGRAVRLLPIDPANTNPAVARSALYITNDQSVAIGRGAVTRYFEQNLGRPIRLERVWVGEIEMVFAELPAFIRDVYAWVDALSPGRLFLSFKTALREAHYPGTVVGQFFLPLEDLIAAYLYATKRRAEAALGHELRDIVLGRPVRFATDPQADAVAQERLIEAALRAGYETVYLEYEPIAAAFHYAASATGDQRILVFDFGGGTLDITIMRVQGARRDVLATGGLPIAGDVFDQKLLRARLARHFGEGSVYGPAAAPLPVPTWIYDTLADWQSLIELQLPERVRMLRDIEATSRAPRQLQNLIALVTGNYGLRMFEAVEAAKRRLSDLPDTDIRLVTDRFRVRQPTSRADFETIIRPEIDAVDRLVDETVARSGLRPQDIDVVIRTGGSSQIPAFQALLARKFGAGRVRSIDTFSSVTSGLGIIGHGIQAGEIDARAYRRNGAVHAALTYEQPRVDPVNLSLLKRRMDDEAGGEGTSGALGLVLYGGHRVAAAPDALAAAPDTAIPLAAVNPDPDLMPQVALAAMPDEPILIATSRYRLLLTSPRQLASLQEGGFARADLRDFEAGEEMCAVARWGDARDAARLLLVTTKGFGRALNMSLSRAAIEGPRSLRLDWPMPNWPAAILGVNPDDQVLVVTDTGRAARVAVAHLSVQGGQLVRVSKARGERVAAVVGVSSGKDQVALLTTDGYARRFPANSVPLATEPGGGQIIVRRPVAGAARVRPGDRVWAVTTQRLVPLDLQRVKPATTPTTKSQPVVTLAEGETVTALLVAAHAGDAGDAQVSLTPALARPG